MASSSRRNPDVVRLLEEEMARQRNTLKQVVNEPIRRGLAPGASRRRRQRHRARPDATTLRPGIDAAALNALTDELEDEAVLAKVARTR